MAEELSHLIFVLCAAMRPLAVAVLTVMLLSWLQVEVEACSDAQTLVHASAALQAIYTRVPRSRGCKHDLNLSEHKPRLGLLASYNASTLRNDYQMVTRPDKSRLHAWVGGCLLGVVT